ncbi:MAG: DUF5615 family PIN-like protein [Endozoicomonas sp.]|uniref:DUF5615 family PIN-like protein n=1 Tax=Endozoicomonas sp. TaxID=1892382 RepID=UPI003D9B2C17
MFLIDENLSYKLAARLEDDFMGIEAVSKVTSLGEGSSDEQVWKYAKNHQLAILTRDKDFVDYWSRLGPPPKVIHLIITNSRLSAIESLIKQNRILIHQFLSENNNGLLRIRA